MGISQLITWSMASNNRSWSIRSTTGDTVSIVISESVPGKVKQVERLVSFAELGNGSDGYWLSEDWEEYFISNETAKFDLLSETISQMLQEFSR